MVPRPAQLQLLGELIRNRKESGIVENRVPDLSDELKPLRDGQFANLGDVFHSTILLPAFNVPR